MHDERTKAPAPGKRNRLRLCLYFGKGCVYTCAPQYVSPACISDDPIADRLNRRNAGYGLDECNAAREVRKAEVPFLFIHGEKDVFVPCRMCGEIYENCASRKRKLIVKDAGHGESYYKDMAAYEGALDSFIGGIMT